MWNRTKERVWVRIVFYLPGEMRVEILAMAVRLCCSGDKPNHDVYLERLHCQRCSEPFYKQYFQEEWKEEA